MILSTDDFGKGGSIRIVGGYGEVGRRVAARLAPSFPGRVELVGRRPDRAVAWATELGNGVRGRGLDLSDLEPGDLPVDAGDVVVACTEADRGRLAPAVIAAGGHYVDVTADLGRIRRLEGLDGAARRRGAVGVLSVGLAPGITNLLAGRAVRRLDQVHRLDVAVVLDARDRHGDEAVGWTLDQLDARSAARRSGRPDPRSAFGARRHFRDPRGRPVVGFRFPFPEGSTLGRTLGVPSVSSWLVLRPALAGHSLSLLARSGASALLSIPTVRAAGIATMRATAGENRRNGAIVEARGRRGGEPALARLAARARGQSETTALIAARVVERLLAPDPTPPGMHHVEQLPDDGSLLARDESTGLEVTESGRAG